MRTTVSRMFLALAVVVIVTACPATNAPKRTPLQTAELAYVQGSVFYEAAMTSLQSLRAQRRVTDAQWARIDTAQLLVQRYAPQVGNLLDVWRATGSKPATFDSLADQVKLATDEVAAVLMEAQ